VTAFDQLLAEPDEGEDIARAAEGKKEDVLHVEWLGFMSRVVAFCHFSSSLSLSATFHGGDEDKDEDPGDSQNTMALDLTTEGTESHRVQNLTSVFLCDRCG
jgi:hypothetical protein